MRNLQPKVKIKFKSLTLKLIFPLFHLVNLHPAYKKLNLKRETSYISTNFPLPDDVFAYSKIWQLHPNIQRK